MASVSGVFPAFSEMIPEKGRKITEKKPENSSGKKWNLLSFYSQLLSIRINVVAFRPAWVISESCTIEAIVCYAVSCQYIYKLRAWILEAFQEFLLLGSNVFFFLNTRLLKKESKLLRGTIKYGSLIKIPSTLFN